MEDLLTLPAAEPVRSAPRRGHARVTGVRSASSIGVARYCDRLAGALADLGLDYPLAEHAGGGRNVHFHLANSSRRCIWQAARTERFVVTLHDVVPRTQALAPLYRGVVYPHVVGRSAATVVHSRYAADVLLGLGGRPGRLEVIAHPATRPETLDRTAARASLGLSPDGLVAVLPGVLKRAKLVREAVLALGSVGQEWRLVLAGPVQDSRAAGEARRAGALVLDHPDDRRYQAAIVAADVVLCLRSRSVGETNGPLLDALGAGRPVLATATGSLPEVAADAARYVRPTAAGIAAGLRALADESERRERSRIARARAAALSWDASAAAHADLFAEVFGG